MSLAAQRLKGKRVLVIGLGISGQAAVRFLLKRGAAVVGTDGKLDQLETTPAIIQLQTLGLMLLQKGETCDVSQFDFIVVSPGVPVTHPLYAAATEKGIEVLGEVELACREINKPCIAITGTNGKTTVTALIEHVLNFVGMKAKALGNIGTPLTQALDENESGAIDIFVIELSSFQLETLSARCIDIAVLLNITPDHLDRYASMQDYAKAKIRIKDNLKISGKLVVEEQAFNEYQSHFGINELQLYGYHPNCYAYTDLKNVYIDGTLEFTLPTHHQNKRSHEVENLMAAYLLCKEMKVAPNQFLEALNSFKKPAHRIEFVRTCSNVHYYDDSKGTNIDAVIRAVQSLDGKIVLIAGGVDKGSPYTPWIEVFSDKVKAICSIGQAAEKIQKDLGDHIEVNICQTLEAAILQATRLAASGDTVLLSPGCSSFDMFKDYAHRGNEFKRIVNELVENKT